MKYKFLIALLFISVSVFAGKYASIQKLHTDTVRAAGGDEVVGWLWMDNIGWISLSSNNDSDPNTPGVQPSVPAYGVSQDPVTLEWSGDAWSPIVGWIHFSPTSCPPGTATDPQHPCGAQVVNGQLMGFAEFVTTQPWWDPYISFSSDNDHDSASGGIQSSSVSYGTSVDSITGAITGYAWHTNGGWLSFFNAYVHPGGQNGPIYMKASDVSATLTDLTLPLAPNPYVTAVGTPDIRLTWMKDASAPNYNNCEIYSSVTAISTPVPCPTATNPLTTDIFTFQSPSATYTLTASDGTVTDTVDAIVNDTTVGAGLCSVNATWQVPPLCPQGTPNFVMPKLKWWTNGSTTSCTGAQPNTSWVTVSPTAGSNVIQTFSTAPANGSTYQVECVDTSMNTCLSPALSVSYLPSSAPACNTTTPTTPQCSDGIDNDGDGLVDFVDNDGDGYLDPQVDVDPPIGVNDFQTDNILNNTGLGPWPVDSYADTGCTSFNDNSESRNNVIIKEK